jgi:putative ABC transport system substrate-binding protein
MNSANRDAVEAGQAAQKAAHVLGVQLQVVGVERPDQFESAFAAMTEANASALFVLFNSLMLERHVPAIIALALQHRLPAMYPWRIYPDAGGLMSYSLSLTDAYQRAAVYVDKILKGAKPADLPVEQPMKFELVINLKTAEALGLTLPPTFLFQADEVIR